jgi:outer membrane biosynthesis protein TonB
MKIYNAKTASVQLPLGIRRLVISGKSLSQDFMPTSAFLQMIARTFTPDDLAIIVSGAWEGNMCAETPTLSEYCVSSIEEALARFNPPEKPKKEEPKPEVKEEPRVEEPKSEEPKEEKVEEESDKETKKTKRVRTAKKVTRKKKTDEEKPVEE